MVASHFGLSGAANGFMPHDFYIKFMLVFVVALPLVIVLLPNQLFSNPNIRINVPHREYWLAPDRRAKTITFLRRHSTGFGLMLVIFLCYIHWLVVRANTVTPPSLPSSWFIAGLIVFVVSTIVWISLLFKRFHRPR
ncbi:MAG: hypothetical protein ACAF41_17460 [Leptolyngbya sp. BL-A-14]